MTRVLQHSLGGNSFTTLLCNIHPGFDNYEESLNVTHAGLDLISMGIIWIFLLELVLRRQVPQHGKPAGDQLY